MSDHDKNPISSWAEIEIPGLRENDTLRLSDIHGDSLFIKVTPIRDLRATTASFVIFALHIDTWVSHPFPVALGVTVEYEVPKTAFGPPGKMVTYTIPGVHLPIMGLHIEA